MVWKNTGFRGRGRLVIGFLALFSFFPLVLLLSHSNSTLHVATVRPFQIHSKPVEVIYYNVIDPYFKLADSGFEDDDVFSLFNDVQQTWSSATQQRLRLRLQKRDLVLSRDRALAYLLYVYGHIKVKPTLKRTNLLYNNMTWLLNAFAPELEQMVDPLYRFGQDVKSMERLSQSLPISRPHFHALNLLSRQEGDVIFPGLVGDAVSEEITSESFADFVTELGMRNPETRRVHLAFRLFYLFCGLSVRRSNQFLAVLAHEPMLLLHYAVGRDKELGSRTETTISNIPDRSQWEFENTIGLFPTYYYHDLNGRGGRTWMDVIFRTASCWFAQNKKLMVKGKDFGLVHCRWGVRDYEKHAYTLPEFSRLIAHEVGHCLGLTHGPVTSCQVFERGEDGNLMQQHRTFALKTWSQCTCLSCATDCQCPYTNREYHEVSKARSLSSDQVELAMKFAHLLDFVETPSTSCLRVGLPVSTMDMEVPLDSSGLLLQWGDSLEVFPGKTKGRVTRLNVRTYFAFPIGKPLLIRVFTFQRQPGNGSCTAAPPQRLKDVVFSARIEGAHLELDLEPDALFVDEHIGLGLELTVDNPHEKSRIRVPAHAKRVEGGINACVRKKDGSVVLLSKHIAVNYHVCA